VRAIRDRDLAVLASVSGIGKKKAERIALELRDRIDDLPVAAETGETRLPSADAVRALVKLGYTPAASETAVRAALDAGTSPDTAGLVRRALSELTRK
jgi:Holliday junction DNA helicase RuvA